MEMPSFTKSIIVCSAAFFICALCNCFSCFSASQYQSQRGRQSLTIIDSGRVLPGFAGFAPLKLCESYMKAMQAGI
jgi:hypothetical protein